MLKVYKCNVQIKATICISVGVNQSNMAIIYLNNLMNKQMGKHEKRNDVNACKA